MMRQILFFGGLLVFFFLVYLMVKNLVEEGRLDARIRATLAIGGGHRFAWHRLLDSVLSAGRFLSTRKERDQLAVRLQQAGFFHEQVLDLFLLGRIAVLILFWLASVFFVEPEALADLLTPAALFMQMVAAFLSSRATEWWLNDRIKTRTARIRRRVPEALELVTICVGSGQTFEQALKQVAGEINPTAPELSVEFDTLHHDLRLNENRSRVLEHFAERTDVKELRAMAQTLIQSMRYGTPLVDALQTTANQSRLAQLDVLKERAGSAPARMSVPLVVFVLFPVIVLLTAPAVLNLMRALGR